MASILLVDDDPDLIEITNLHLCAAGHNVELASGGREAFKKWQSSKYDLIVTDMRMPQGTGLELLTQVRSKDKKFPVIIMSGFSAELPDTHALNPQAILGKPVAIAELLDTINRVLAGAQ